MQAGFPPRPFTGWRGLGLFWLIILAILGGGALWLQALGPVAPAESAPPQQAAVSPAPVADPPIIATPTRVEPSAPPPAAEAPTPSIPAPTAPSPAAPAIAAATTAPPATPAAPSAPPAPAADTPLMRAEAPTPSPIAAPEPGLLEEGRFGPLPRVGDGGRTSIRAYAGAFDRQDTRPRVAVVIADIGISTTQTEDAIRRLPAGITLAISPYAPRPSLVAERARAKGMESLAAIPLEPAGYPLNDPGNRALLTGRSAPENFNNLEWVLSRFQGYVGTIGVIGGMRGERFAALEQGFLAMQEVLRSRGLLYIDARPGAPAPARAWGRSVDVILDEPATRAQIERRLAELESLAKARGSALGLAHAATPVVVDRLQAWAAELEERGVALAPVTALIRRPETPTEGRAP